MAECLLEIGKSIFTQCLLPDIKIHFDYWWCFDNNIQGLKDGVGDLETKISNINIEIEAARLRTEIIRSEVEHWANSGPEKLAEARRTLQDDINPKAWNLISRYSMGKRAKKAAEEIAKHRNGGNFDAISDAAPPPAMESTSHRSTMDFDSRKCIEEDIMKSLKESSVDIIGICGMGGVGKTTMAQRIRERVMEEKLFDEVVMVVVSQQIDMLKIQDQIAKWLKLNFDENDNYMPTRAYKLRMRLMDKKRKIIIFDDVWKSLKLEDLGIPLGSGFEMCKIILTTRSRVVCKEMGAWVTAMEILTEEEAWILFKEKAGNCVDDSVLLSVAQDVAAECKGLPIALVTVGMALRNEKNKSIWEDSLLQLSRSNPVDFPEFLVNVYKPLKLSYDYLENEREQLLFLLCCLFPEDYDIPVEQLTLYFMGLRLFDGISSIEEARNRMNRLLENLKRRFLLIDGEEKFHVKMHDVVRDVGIYIGSKEKNGFLKSLNKTSIESSSDVNCNWMSVDISNERIDKLRFPKLRLLMLLQSSYEKFSDISFEGMEDLLMLLQSSYEKFSDISFEGMEDLNVLKWIGSLPPTLGLLQNLRTLCLFECKVENISVIGELTSLEVFSCNECENIKELPAVIGKLNCLRLLELIKCSKLQRIPFGILSSLFGLEELKIRNSFNGWEAEENGKEMRNASLKELECLPKLSCLEIEISDSNLAAQEIRLSQKLVKYKIYIASEGYWFEERDYEKLMKLNLCSEIGAVGNWIRQLVRSSESVSLEGDGSDNINIEECQDLRNLEFRNCSRVKICDRTIILNQNVLLCNLKSLEISGCSNLRTLFSVSIAGSKSLSQLEVLEIEGCDKMEQVFLNNITYDTDASIEFPKLKKLRLENLLNLTAFCQGLQTIKFPELTDMRIERLPKLNSLCPLNSETPHHDTTSFHFLCNQKVEIGGLKTLILSKLRDNINNIWGQQITINFFNNLKKLIIFNLNGIRSLMSTSIAKNLVSLKRLQIRDCKEMVEVIEDDTDASIEFPKLKKLRLENLPNLTAFSQGLQTIKFPELTEIEIEYLPKLNILCPLNSETTHDHTTSFHFLCNQKVEFGGLEILRLQNLGDNIISNIWCQQIPINIFNNLQKLIVCQLNGIRSLMSTSIAKNLVSLESLSINSCKEMVEVIEDNTDDGTDASIEFPKLKELTLRHLPNLTFCQGLQTIKFPELTAMNIGNLPKLNSLCPLDSETTHHDTTSFHFLCNQKVEFGGLCILRVSNFDNNIKNIWCDRIPINYFNNLQNLTIFELNGIRSLMSYSIAIKLVSLESLYIHFCEEMVEVIEVNEDDKEVLVDDIKSLFPALKTLNIWGLHKLRRFWQWNQTLESPLLKEVIINDCPVMDTFTLGSLQTPNIRRITIQKNKMDAQKDLNYAIHLARILWRSRTRTRTRTRT